MLDSIRTKLHFAKEKISTVTAELNDPIRVMLLEHRLKKAEARALEYQGLYHIYLRQLTVINRAMQRKSYSVKNLRTKIKRMEDRGIIDHEVVRLGKIPLDKVKRPNGEDISPDAA